MNAFVNMKKSMEILNLLVGFELIVVGFLYLMKNDIPSAASWSIFGCMYVVMDKYSVLKNISKKRKFIDRIKYSFAWIGFIISTTFLIHVVLNF